MPDACCAGPPSFGRTVDTATVCSNIVFPLCRRMPSPALLER